MDPTIAMAAPTAKNRAMLPLNLKVLSPKKEQLKTLSPVTTLDIFDGPGGNFHENGLFSTQIFGRVGDEIRNRRFGYIDLKIPVMHPSMFATVSKLKGFYRGILAGTEYANWDSEKKDFVQSDALNGQTGYTFFTRHWDELTPPKTGSSIRDLRISLLEKERANAFLSYLLVLPAGLRDVDIEADGRTSMDEINELYQSVLMLSRNIPENLRTDADLTIYDRTRFSLTVKIQEIYDYIVNLISGKKGYIQRRWASRRVFNTTRNVLSSLDTTAVDLDQPNRPGFKSVVAGIHQVSKGVLPKTIYFLKNSVVGEVFDTATNRVELVNPETYQREWVEVGNEDMDRWATEEGLEKVINDLSVIEKRDRPILIEGHYLALIYVDDKQNYMIVRDIRDLPDNLDPNWLRPLTLIELIYLSGVDHWNTYPAFVTRYPVENYNSSIPLLIYVKTTARGEMRYRLTREGVRDAAGLALEFPVFNDATRTQYHDSLSLPPSILAALGADFDGDTGSLNITYSDDSIEEGHAFFKKRKAYIQAGGGLAFSVNIHTLALTLSFITGDPE